MIISVRGVRFRFDDNYREPVGCRAIMGGYMAYRTRHRSNGKERASWLLAHRHILNAKSGKIVDHINGNKHDNRSSNLRIVNPLESTWNRAVVGCTRHSCGKWQAAIRTNGKTTYLGLFRKKSDAVAAHFAAALAQRGSAPRVRKLIKPMSPATEPQ